MNILFENIVSDKTLLWGFLLSFITIIGCFVYIVLSYNHLPPLIPLYNQMPWGPSRLAQKIEIFIPLSIAASIFIFNLLFSSIFYKKIPLTSRIICITSFLVSLFALLAVVRTLQLVI